MEGVYGNKLLFQVPCLTPEGRRHPGLAGPRNRPRRLAGWRVLHAQKGLSDQPAGQEPRAERFPVGTHGGPAQGRLTGNTRLVGGKTTLGPPPTRSRFVAARLRRPAILRCSDHPVDDKLVTQHSKPVDPRGLCHGLANGRVFDELVPVALELVPCPRR